MRRIIRQLLCLCVVAGCEPSAGNDDDDAGMDCSEHTDCNGGEVCERGECVPASGGSCDEDEDCIGGEVCDGGECVRAPGANSGAVCVDDGDPCEASEDCCDFSSNPEAGDSACITDGDITACAAYCESGDGCVSGCCAELEDNWLGACAPAEFCEGGTSGPAPPGSDSNDDGFGTGTPEPGTTAPGTGGDGPSDPDPGSGDGTGGGETGLPDPPEPGGPATSDGG